MLARVLALDVEAVWIEKDVWVAIRPCQVDDDPYPAAYQGALNVAVFGRNPCAELNWRVQPQDLLDRGRPQLGSVSQRLEVFWRFEQHPNPLAQQVNRGLEAGRQHQSRCRQQFPVRQRTSLCAFGGQNDLAHQIVARVAAQFVQVVREPVAETLDAGTDRSVLTPGQADVEAGGAEFTEPQDAGPRVVRYSEDVADHGGGELRAVAVDDVDGAGVVGEIVEKRVGGLLHPIAQRGHGTCGEHRGHQLAVARVIGRLNRQHGRRLDRMNQVGLRAVGHPLQRLGQVRPQPEDVEVVGSQQVIGDLVVDGYVHGATLHDRAPGA